MCGIGTSPVLVDVFAIIMKLSSLGGGVGRFQAWVIKNGATVCHRPFGHRYFLLIKFLYFVFCFVCGGLDCISFGLPIVLCVIDLLE